MGRVLQALNLSDRHTYSFAPFSIATWARCLKEVEKIRRST